MPEFLIIWHGVPALIVLLIMLHLRYKQEFRVSKYFHHDILMGAQCTCGEEMRINQKFILSYEDKQQAESQVQDWIIQHRKEHGTAG